MLAAVLRRDDRGRGAVFRGARRLQREFRGDAAEVLEAGPDQGLGRLFSVKGLMELLKSLGKFLLVGSATVAVLSAWSDELIGLGDPMSTSRLREGCRWRPGRR